MHQDQRIGLALGVLLLGAAGAFFFRNDPHPAKPGPRLKTARELDARIAEKSLSPYLQSIREDEPSFTGGGSRRSRDSLREIGPGHDGSLPPLDDPDFSSIRNDSTTGRPFHESQPERGDRNLTPIPMDEGDEIVTESGTAANTGSSRSSKPERIHVVQKGESLSSISARELGSANRFGEIFEANRDQLNNADDVRIGMSLRIPSRDGTVSVTPRPSRVAPPLLPADVTHRDAEERPEIPTGENDNASANGGKFEPAKRLPLGVQGSAPQAFTPRRLSQTPPQDAGGKVAR